MQLIERKLPFRKFIEFPEMKGRTLDKVKLSTTSDYHSLTLDFQDKTQYCSLKLSMNLVD